MTITGDIVRQIARACLVAGGHDIVGFHPPLQGGAGVAIIELVDGQQYRLTLEAIVPDPARPLCQFCGQTVGTTPARRRPGVRVFMAHGPKHDRCVGTGMVV